MQRAIAGLPYTSNGTSQVPYDTESYVSWQLVNHSRHSYVCSEAQQQGHCYPTPIIVPCKLTLSDAYLMQRATHKCKGLAKTSQKLDQTTEELVIPIQALFTPLAAQQTSKALNRCLLSSQVPLPLVTFFLAGSFLSSSLALEKVAQQVITPGLFSQLSDLACEQRVTHTTLINNMEQHFPKQQPETLCIRPFLQSPAFIYCCF